MAQQLEKWIANQPAKEEPLTELEWHQEWKRLLRQYHSVLRVTEGCGRRGQCNIDAHYERMQKHLDRCPGTALLLTARNEMPPKYVCRDDGTDGGTDGMASGMAACAQS